MASIVVPPVLADWTFTPVARQGVEYDYNPVIVPTDSFAFVGNTADFATELSESLEHHTGQTDLTVKPRQDFNYFPDAGFLNHNDQYLDASADYNFERTTWMATSGLVHDSTLISELGTTGLTAGNRKHDSISFSLGPSFQLTPLLSLAGQGAYQRVIYQNSSGTGLVNYNYYGGDVSATYLASERMKLAIDMAVNRLDVPESDLLTTSYAPTASVTYQLSELWTSTAGAGPAYVTSRYGKYTGYSGAASLQRTGLIYNASGRISQDIVPNGQGLLTTRDQITLAGFRSLTEQLSMTVTAYYSQSRELPTNPVSVSVEPILIVGPPPPPSSGPPPPPPEAPPGPSVFTVRFRSLETAFFWKFSQNWQAESLVLYQQQDIQEDSTGAATHAEGFRVGLKLIWSGDPRTFRQP